MPRSSLRLSLPAAYLPAVPVPETVTAIRQRLRERIPARRPPRAEKPRPMIPPPRRPPCSARRISAVRLSHSTPATTTAYGSPTLWRPRTTLTRSSSPFTAATRCLRRPTTSSSTSCRAAKPHSNPTSKGSSARATRPLTSFT